MPLAVLNSTLIGGDQAQTGQHFKKIMWSCGSIVYVWGDIRIFILPLRICPLTPPPRARHTEGALVLVAGSKVRLDVFNNNSIQVLSDSLTFFTLLVPGPPFYRSSEMNILSKSSPVSNVWVVLSLCSWWPVFFPSFLPPVIHLPRLLLISCLFLMKFLWCVRKNRYLLSSEHMCTSSSTA